MSAQKPTLRKLEEAVLEAARNIVREGQASGSTLPPGERGIGGATMTYWVPGHRVEELEEAAYALMREEQRIAEGISDGS